MATTPNNGFRYPAGTDAPDGPGALYNLATDLDNFLASGGFTPALSGSGATTGTGGSTTGTYARTGNIITATGRIAFGSGTLSFGSAPAVTGLPNFNTASASGTGAFIPASGAAPAALMLLPITPSQFGIRVVLNGSTASAATLTPAQSDIVLFTITGAKA